MQGGLIPPERSGPEVGKPVLERDVYLRNQTRSLSSAPPFSAQRARLWGSRAAQANPAVCNSAKPLYKERNGLSFLELVNTSFLERFLVYIVGQGFLSLRSQLVGN